MKILHLTLKKRWFDMILSGEKKEEYREIKPYWEGRLYNKSFDIVRFKNGYSKNVPTFDIECIRIRIGYGIDNWGGIGTERYYVIELGNLIKKL